MKKTRVIARIAVATLASAGLVLGLAASSSARPREDRVMNHHSAIHHASHHASHMMTSKKDTGWG
ncbi:MAG: hypothetical protein ACR2FG_03085 [Marmoricola sp.]